MLKRRTTCALTHASVVALAVLISPSIGCGGPSSDDDDATSDASDSTTSDDDDDDDDDDNDDNGESGDGDEDSTDSGDTSDSAADTGDDDDDESSTSSTSSDPSDDTSASDPDTSMTNDTATGGSDDTQPSDESESDGNSTASDSDESQGDTSQGDSGPTTSEDSEGDANPCDNILRAVVRDMSIDHPDFETFSGSNATKGLVEDTLDEDRKPIHAASGATSQTTGPANFAQWYHDVQGTNFRFTRDLTLTETSPGVWRYENTAFFPLADDEGWGDEGKSRNFAFTTEIHLSFQYQEGQVFNFNGDDDLWLFIDGQLALDLGGLHPPVAGSVDLDEVAADLDLKEGHTYTMDIFHAERHSTGSTFIIETSIGCIMPQ